MKRQRHIFLSLLLCMALVLGNVTLVFAEEDPSADSGKVTVTIYTTNDIHGVVEDVEGIIGMARAAGIKASTENALLVDAGDATQGASFATITQGADVIRMMNAAKYDAMAAGNHEFDYGADRLLANKSLADFPILSANVLKDGSPLLEDNTVIEVKGYKIAFIGLTTTATATSTNPSQLQGITFADEVQTAKEQIAKVQNEADAIIFICHMGDNATAVDCTSGNLLDALDESERSKVTAVVDGHSHTLENETYEDTSIPVIQTGTQFTSLGVIKVTFDEDRSSSAVGHVMDYEEAVNYELTADGEAAMHAVTDTLQQIKSEQKSVLGENLCTNETPLWGGYIYYDYAESRIVETNYGDFVTDAFADSAKIFAAQQKIEIPVVAVENGGGISATLPYGQVTRGDVLNAFNHGNMVTVQKITAAQLYEALEGGLVVTGQDETGLLVRERVSGSFLQVSGFTYTYDPAGDSYGKVTNVLLDDGTTLRRTDNSTYLLLATNNYVASFNAFADADIIGELGGEDLIVENYILKQTENGLKSLSVPVTANRIRIANDISPDTYEVEIPVTDGTIQGEEEPTILAKRVVHLQVDDGEAAEYVTDAEGNLHLSLEKGPHTLYLTESLNQQPVYVNNYSGSGTVTTADGYYSLRFVVEPDSVKESDGSSSDDTPGTGDRDNKPGTGDNTSGAGNNTGNVSQAEQEISYTQSIRKAYGCKPFNLGVKLTKGNGALAYISSDQKVAVVDRSTGKVTVKGTGRAVITVTAAETKEYKEKSVMITIDISPKKQTVGVKAKSGKKLLVKWKKDSRATGYQIQYSTNKNFKKNTNTITVKKNKTISKTIKKLKKGKAYYVRVCSYKTIKENGKGKKLYGAYSKVKKSRI